MEKERHHFRERRQFLYIIAVFSINLHHRESSVGLHEMNEREANQYLLEVDCSTLLPAQGN